MLTEVIAPLSALDLGLIVFVVALAGFVKGAVGFAMPMIIISGVGSIATAELALVTLILSTLVSNVWQALRNGPRAAWASARSQKVYIGVLLIFIAIGAQLVAFISDRVLFLMLGVVLGSLAFIQLIGVEFRIPPSKRRQAEIGVGTAAGLVGGISGVWGPPTAIYLTALNTPKVEQMRTQGVIYGLGALMLTVAHIQSGVLNASTAPYSALMVIPALFGMVIGFLAQDRMDQARFRKATLLVLCIASLNLIRRGLTL